MSQKSRNRNFNTLSMNAFFSINKALLRYFDGNWTVVIILSDLISTQRQLEDMLPENGEFWRTQSQILESTHVSGNTQSVALGVLIKEGIITVTKKGLPAKNYFTIDHDRIDDIISNTVLSGVPVTPKLGDCSPKNWVSTDPKIGCQNNNKEKNNKEESIKKILSYERIKGSAIPGTKRGHENLPMDESPSCPKIMKLHRRPVPNPEQTPLPVSLKSAASQAMIQTANEKAEAIRIEIEQARKDKKDKRRAKQQKIIDNMKESTQLLIEYWNELGLKQTNPIKAVAGYAANIASLELIQKGKLIPGESRKFTPEDIKATMYKFSLQVLDKNYMPVNKEKIAACTIADFLYSSNPSNGGHSRFIQLYDGPPLEPIKPDIEIIEDKHPEATRNFKKFYIDYVCAGVTKKSGFTPSEENKFRQASIDLWSLFLAIRNKTHGIDSLAQMATLMCQSIKKQYGEHISSIYPGSFASSQSRTRLLAYLQEIGLLENYRYEDY